MQKQSSSLRLWRCLPSGFLVMLCPVLIITLLSIFALNSNIAYYPRWLIASTARTNTLSGYVDVPESLHSRITNLQTELGDLLGQLNNSSSESKFLVRISDQVLHIALSFDRLVDSLSLLRTSGDAWRSGNGMNQIDQDFNEPHENVQEDEEPFVNVFKSGELLSYITPKPNRPNGKKNFLGVDAIKPSIGLACTHMVPYIERYMSYKVYEICPDDMDLVQKLLSGGCDPLPRRRCFSRSPPKYKKPSPVNSSLWMKPSDDNILWNIYKCKSYLCLISNEKMDTKGFFKCADCFNLTKRGWEVVSNESVSADLTIDEVLSLKPGEIHIGLDFGPTTGTFAALMKDRNVTIASATLNLGAPFNEVIALRGLLPLYVSIGSRLPFSDNTLDLVHSTLFLDGWISFELLQFVLFDWDRIIRPLGLLWIDRFFCKKEDMKLYIDEFERLGYKKLLWRVVPKSDKLEDEFFFSGVLEKPIRK